MFGLLSVLILLFVQSFHDTNKSNLPVDIIIISPTSTPHSILNENEVRPTPKLIPTPTHNPKTTLNIDNVTLINYSALNAQSNTIIDNIAESAINHAQPIIDCSDNCERENQTLPPFETPTPPPQPPVFNFLPPISPLPEVIQPTPSTQPVDPCGCIPNSKMECVMLYACDNSI